MAVIETIPHGSRQWVVVDSNPTIVNVDALQNDIIEWYTTGTFKLYLKNSDGDNTDVTPLGTEA